MKHMSAINHATASPECGGLTRQHDVAADRLTRIGSRAEVHGVGAWRPLRHVRAAMRPCFGIRMAGCQSMIRQSAAWSRFSRTLITRVALLMLGGFLGSAVVWGDLVVVTVRTADVYHNNRVRGALLQNEVVYAERVRGDQDWLHIWMDGQPYLSRRKNFLSEADLNIQYRRDKLFIDSRLAQIDRELQSNAERRGELRDYILEVEWDQTSCYQVKIVIEPQQVTGSSNAASHTVLMSGKRPPEIHYKYYDKISLGKSRRLLRDWEKEIDKLTRRDQELMNEYQQFLADQISNEKGYKATVDRFQRFLKSNDTYRQELYLVSANHASLFENRVKKRELEKDDLVIAQPDKRYLDRLEVLMGNRFYDSPLGAYQSWNDWELACTITAATINNRIALDNRCIEELEKSINSYQEFIDDLTYVVGISDEYVYFRHRRINKRSPSPRDEYWLRIPSESREMVHRPRAKRLLKQWQEELAELKSKVDSKWIEIEKANQELLSLEEKRNEIYLRSSALGYIGK